MRFCVTLGYAVLYTLDVDIGDLRRSLSIITYPHQYPRRDLEFLKAVWRLY